MYFIDRTKVNETLEHMEELLALYGETKEWTGNLMDSLALARLAHVIVESIIDVGNTMIDGFIMRDPGGYEDIIDIMDDEQVISKEMSEPLKRVIGLRKMIVRDFNNVDVNLIESILSGSMDALSEFPGKVRYYLENELGPFSAFLPEVE
ncbi:DUF86 domain-containing protein [Sporosarcina siberiensis]|uniref:DUF86 domain-containing protein n=1 Tax=Sporosarcina siberiensis TaxID=1365606 RepID=A0ABW4SDV3_9BACL